MQNSPSPFPFELEKTNVCSQTSSQPFTPHQYNYHDYTSAWHKVFYIRNFDRSWFFHFHHNIQKDFPLWFQEWFDIFGPVQEIFPDPV